MIGRLELGATSPKIDFLATTGLGGTIVETTGIAALIGGLVSANIFFIKLLFSGLRTIGFCGSVGVHFASTQHIFNGTFLFRTHH